MCLALLAIGQHPLHPVIILSNRDEFYERDSAPADFWHENPNVFSGKDLIKHGAWLGINKNGNFALLTNYRDPKLFKPSMQSRGLLVSNYLSEYAGKSSLEYIHKVKSASKNYNKFNLIIGDVTNAYYFSNVKNKAKKLSTGIYCISNHLLDTPWFKVERAKELFVNMSNALLACNDRDKIYDLLFNILSDITLSPDHQLPQTGMSMDLEKSLSSIFVNIPQHKYGTYSSSIILFERNNILFAEKIFKNGHLVTFKKTDIDPLSPLF